MGYFNTGELKVVAKKVLLGQAISFLNSVTGVSTTKLVNNDASYPLLQSITSYLFIFLVYGPLFIFFLHRYRGKSFSNFAFLQNWWKYAILGFVDLEANYLVVLAYQYTNMMSIQLLDCFTIPCVLVLSLVILKMRFGPAHVLGCIVALGGMGLLIYLDAGGLSYTGDKGKEVLGDILCLLSSCCYALSNVLTEWFIKPKELAPLADRGAEQLGMDTQTQQGVPTAENVPSEKFVTLDDEPAQNAENQDQGDDDAQEVPPVPIYLPVIENLAMMSAFALCFATAQFFILEWKTFAPRRKKWTSEDWLFQMVFGITMLCLYTGMPTLFLITSAAFANISLLTADIYSILWNVTIFSIYPSAYFLFAYIIIVCGILLYNLPDVAKSSWMSNWNFLSGCRGGNPKEEDARGVLNKPERTEMASDPHNSKIETPR